MSESVNVYEAKTHLSQLLDRAAAGEEIVIARAGRESRAWSLWPSLRNAVVSPANGTAE